MPFEISGDITSHYHNLMRGEYSGSFSINDETFYYAAKASTKGVLLDEKRGRIELTQTISDLSLTDIKSKKLILLNSTLRSGLEKLLLEQIEKLYNTLNHMESSFSFSDPAVYGCTEEAGKRYREIFEVRLPISVRFARKVDEKDEMDRKIYRAIESLLNLSKSRSESPK